MNKSKKSIVWALAGAFTAGTMGLAGIALAEGPKARADRERDEARAKARAEAERAENKNDHPEVWNAIKALRKARDEVQWSRNEKQKLKDDALKAINTALKELEELMAR